MECLRHPIWSCSVRGFACHRRYRRRGALLPHLFTLTSVSQGGIFSVPLVRQVTLPGSYPAHCPAEFGLSSPSSTSRSSAVAESSGRPADCDTLIVSYCSEFWVLYSRFVFRFVNVTANPARGTPKFEHLRRGSSLAVDFLLDPVLLELFVEVTARRIDDVGGLRDVPIVLAQLLH